jgi:VanZ family protein
MRVTRRISSKVLIKSWLPLIAWASLIFVFSTDTFSSDNTAGILEPLLRGIFPTLAIQEIEQIHLAIRKLGHLSEYFLFARLLMRGLREQLGGAATWRECARSTVITILFAITDEWHQSFVPSRTASAIDVLIDAIGGICGTLSAYRRNRFKNLP